MSTETQNALEQQRERRKRVNRIKNGIIITISLWMIFSLLAIIILSVSVVKLNRRVRALEGKKALLEQQVSTEPIKESSIENQENSAAMEKDDLYANVIRGIDTPENMAKEGDKHYVYLTFDCEVGENTQKILDVLEEYQVKATFFVSGDTNEELIPIYQRIVEDGHTLGMHSYSNQYSMLYTSTDAFYNDYKQISDFLYETCGIRSEYYRFPGGSGNEISNVDMAEFVHILNEEQITFFDWNVSAGDAAFDYSVDDIVNNVTKGIANYKTSVVLLHDGADKSTTAEALGPLIEALGDMGAEVLPIDENTDVIQYIKADSVE